MGLDIWFAEDIRNALLAANEASAQTAAVIAEVGGASPFPPQAQAGQAVTDSTELLAVTLRAYREGYKAALTTVALAFGIAPQAVIMAGTPEELAGTVRIPAQEDAAWEP